jgi:hypothetical protein
MDSDLDQNLLGAGTAGEDITPPPAIGETRPVAKVLTEDIGFIRWQVRHLHSEADELHHRSHFTEWATRTKDRARASVQELLADLADLGFSWRDVARLVGVSVPALQKWRRGERTTGENRLKVAGLIAACDLVAEHYGIQEVASWFETPVLHGVPVTPIDLWAGERRDLVFDLASDHADPEQTLTAWDPQWRERYQSDFEVFRGSDGNLSIRPKER